MYSWICTDLQKAASRRSTFLKFENISCTLGDMAAAHIAQSPQSIRSLCRPAFLTHGRISRLETKAQALQDLWASAPCSTQEVYVLLYNLIYIWITIFFALYILNPTWGSGAKSGNTWSTSQNNPASFALMSHPGHFKHKNINPSYCTAYLAHCKAYLQSAEI